MNLRRELGRLLIGAAAGFLLWSLGTHATFAETASEHGRAKPEALWDKKEAGSMSDDVAGLPGRHSKPTKSPDGGPTEVMRPKRTEPPIDSKSSKDHRR